MISADIRDEVSVLVEDLRQLLDELALRGLANAGDGEGRRLAAAGDELNRLGAAHLAGFFHQLAEAVGGASGGGDVLFRARNGLQLFESLVSRQIALSQLESLISDEPL